MDKQYLQLHKTVNNNLRAVVKTQHGRTVYLSLRLEADNFIVNECYYIDRGCNGKYNSKPKKFITYKFPCNEILNIISKELDRKFIN